MFESVQDISPILMKKANELAQNPKVQTKVESLIKKMNNMVVEDVVKVEEDVPGFKILKEELVSSTIFKIWCLICFLACW